MSLGYLILLISAALSVAASVSLHRYLGFVTMAAGGAAVNYFFMEPVHSFHVSQIGDISALGFYAVIGTFVVFDQNASVRHAAALALSRFQHRRCSLSENTDLLDVYHFDLLVQLCAEIGRMRGTSVDLRDVLNIALKRLGADSQKSSREILDDVGRQLEYEEWVTSHLSKNKMGNSAE